MGQRLLVILERIRRLGFSVSSLAVFTMEAANAAAFSSVPNSAWFASNFLALSKSISESGGPGTKYITLEEIYANNFNYSILPENH